MILNALLELLGVGMILPLITVLLNEDPSFLPASIYQLIEGIDHIELVKFTLLALILIYIIKNLFIVFYNYQQGLYLRNLQIRVVSDLFRKYILENYNFFLQKSTGTILRNVNVARIISLCLFSYLMLSLEIIVITCFLTYLLYLNFTSTIIIISIFVIFGIALYMLTKKKLYLWGSLKQDYDAKINQQIIQSFSLIKNIKIFNKEKTMYNFFYKSLFNIENLTLKIDIVQQLPRALAETLGVVSISILIFVLSIVGKTNIEIIGLTAIYAAAAFRLIPSSTRIITAAQRIKNYAPSLNLIRDEFSTSKRNFFNNHENKADPLKFKNIIFDKVSFRYENTNKEILSNINFQINQGEIIGLYGESGSGKSTLINLISGLIKPTNGEIKINNEKFDTKKDNWLSSLGYTPQQVTLFNDTIANNISFFENELKHKDTKKKIDKVLDVSNLKNFIEGLPDKENTQVGENAAKLSGGQIQRIGICRALFNDPQFIIFDESTNSLDEKNEKEIMQFIYSLKKNKTVLIISHNKEILYNCDKIYEVKNSNINKVK
jgi:ABC-type bacteriocin/lantibiotic exporter with double-glycine peptidase domain